MKIYDYEMVPFLVGETEQEILGNSAERLAEYLKGAFDSRPEQEQIYLIFLNRKNKIIGRHLLTIGTQTACLAHPSTIFRAVLASGATAFAMAHNHPSGDPAPSAADLQITRMVREAANVIDLTFVDHIIIGDKNSDPLNKGIYSFRNAGLL